MTAPLLVVAVLVTALALPTSSRAQARAGDTATAPPSQLAAAFERFAEALATRLIGADDAASRWLSGRLSSLDPAARVRDYAAAFAREPKEMLYVASLADACMAAAGLSDCTERDAVGYWASRDADNAVPWLLQAERARRRNNLAAAIDNLDRAAKASRYDSYERRAGAVVANKLGSLVAPADRAAVALYASDTPAGAHLTALEAMCSAALRAQDPRVAAACSRLGTLMAERATLLAERRAGTQLELASPAPRSDVVARARAVVAEQERCRDAIGTVERLAAGGPAERDRAVSLGEGWLNARAREGDSAACAALAQK